MITKLELDIVQDASTFLHELADNPLFDQTEGTRLKEWSRLIDLLIEGHDKILTIKKLARVPHKPEEENSDDRTV